MALSLTHLLGSLADAQGLQDLAIYALAIAALGLLPIKERRADQGVSLMLALLWTKTAFAAYGSNPWWAVLAGVEAALFLFAIGKSLRFSARTGSWAVAGAVLTLCSLLLFPLLAFFNIPIFGRSAFDAPFPLVLLTCGILFFAMDSITNLLLIVPLVWAFLGGPEDSRGPVELAGLEIALLAGALFLVLPSELRAGSDLRSPPGASYRIAHQRRAAFSYGLWAQVLATAFLILAARQLHALEQITISLALLSMLGIVLWLAYPAWQSLWYRYVAWGAANAGGRIGAWFRESWRWGLLLVAVLAVLWSWASPAKQSPQTPPATKTKTAGPGPLSLVQSGAHDARDILATFLPAGKTVWAASAVGLLWLLLEAYQGRRRLVIGSFDDKTGENKVWASGLGVQLQNELARIADLYKVIDEARPTRKSDVVQVVPGVEDPGTILKEAITTTLGSTGFATQIAGLFTRLVRGPQLKGAVHKVGEDYVITSNLSGGGLAFSWRVDAGTLGEDEKQNPTAKDVPRALLEQLAFRIATDLVSIGSPRWRAVRSFTEGLWFYRETQRQNDKSYKLREAERCFIRALNDDLRFTQCHYNLGVVYRQLGEPGSAESAFRRVLRENPGHFEACYALAETLVYCKKYEEAIQFCETAIGIDPGDARAWDLWAHTLRRREQRRVGAEVALDSSHPGWGLIREKREIAVALAWRSLCREALRGPFPTVPSEMTTALLCTRNLAVVLTRTKRYSESERVFQQAAWLAPHDPHLGVYEGRNLFWTENWKDAQSVLGGTLDEGLEPVNRGLLWSTLAQAHAASDPEPANLNSARSAHQRFLDLAAGASPEDLRKLMDFSLEAPPAQSDLPDRDDTRLDKEKEIDKRWGLGSGRDRAGYRGRLKRLCQFCLALEPDGQTDTRRSDLAILRSSVDAWKKRRQGGDAAYVQRLKDLHNASKELERRESNGQEETEEQYLARLLRWTPRPDLIPGEAPEVYAERQQALDRVFGILGTMANGPASALASLGEDISSLEHDQAIGACEARSRWRAMIREIIADWEWAYFQILVHRAQECLTRSRLDRQSSAWAEEAAVCLAEAIEKLEHRGFSQPRTQGLYGLLSESVLLQAKVANVRPENRLELIQTALTYARRAVEIDPENVNERRVLIEILSLLGDFEEVQIEAEVALNLDAGPETLRTIGASFWDQAASLRARDAHDKALQEAVSFFENAKRHVESVPLDKGCPLEQIETHGWAHYWLGRFQGERGRFDEAAVHLGTAAALGFKPVESRVRLAWIYLEARAYDQAGRAFRDAVATAGTCTTLVAAPGEDQPIEDLKFHTSLGRAFLALVAPAEPDSAGQSAPAPNEPEKSIAAAEACLKASNSLKDRIDFQALLCEAWGRAHLGRKEPVEATRDLEMAVRLSPRSSAYCYLAYARLEQTKAAADDAEKLDILAKAREAYQLAVDMDSWGRLDRELAILLGRLQLAETPPPIYDGANPAGAGEVPVVN